MNFLKDIYLAKGITHTAGLANFLVMIDGHLAGGFIYSRDKWGGDLLYLLSDFALSPRSRVSKLIAMLATSATITDRMEVRLVQRIDSVDDDRLHVEAGVHEVSRHLRTVGPWPRDIELWQQDQTPNPSRNLHRVVPAVRCKRASHGCGSPT